MDTATIYSYSVIYSSTFDFQDKTPYLCAVLETSPENRLVSFIEGYKEGTEVKIGQQVYRVKSKDGIGADRYSLVRSL